MIVCRRKNKTKSLVILNTNTIFDAIFMLQKVGLNLEDYDGFVVISNISELHSSSDIVFWRQEMGSTTVYNPYSPECTEMASRCQALE